MDTAVHLYMCRYYPSAYKDGNVGVCNNISSSATAPPQCSRLYKMQGIGNRLWEFSKCRHHCVTVLYPLSVVLAHMRCTVCTVNLR